MSLVNDMLRDLDARRIQPASGNMTALPSAGTGVMKTGISRQGIAWLVAGICLLCTLAISAPMFADYLTDLDSDMVITTATEVEMEMGIPIALDIPAQVAESPAATRDEPILVPTQSQVDTVANRTPNLPAREDPDPMDMASAAEPGGSETPGTEPQFEITLHTSPSVQLARDYRRAASAASAGRDSDAIDQLEHILTSDSAHHEARQLLATLFIRQQRHANAESLLVGGLQQHPLHAPYARLLARLLVTQDRDRAAIEHLQTALPGATGDAEYHALLAGLYQRSSDPVAASMHYQTALKLAPARGEWWMGLGISQEQAGNNSAAHAAYRQALRYPLTTALQDYINNRLQRLTGDVSLHVITNLLPENA